MKKETKKQKVYSKEKNMITRIILLVSFLSIIVLGFIYIYKPLLSPCANSISCINNLSGNYQKEEKKAIYLGKVISSPKDFRTDFSKSLVLGESKKNSNKHIYIDLSTQRLYAFEDNNLVYNFSISSGKWYETPTGNFNIWIKLRHTRMTGGSRDIGTYYDVPNVPYTMYFYNNEISKNRGFGIHGAYWHNNFGHPMSHGCVNMRVEDAEKLYYWTNPEVKGNITYTTKDDIGTAITIYGQTPKE